jgi:TatD DNase family protein
MLLSLMDDPNRIAVQGKVVWITPEGVQGNRTQGIGVSSRRTRPAPTPRPPSRRSSARTSRPRARPTRCRVFVDSHCHLDFPELRDDLPAVLDAMRANQVTHALVIAVDMPGWPVVHGLAAAHANLYASVGVHPDYQDTEEPTRELLAAKAREGKIVAIGETGLDYYRLTGDLEWQRERFRTHIRAARDCGRPLVVHTRSAADDTLRIMREEGAGEVGGVMHLLHRDVGGRERRAGAGLPHLVLGHRDVQERRRAQGVARRVPLERMLIETDSPYLAPVPFRGKRNQPAYVRHVARRSRACATCRSRRSPAATTANFFICRHRLTDMLKIRSSAVALLLALAMAAPGALAQELYDDLIFAVTNDRVDEVRALLARGVDPNSVDAGGNSLLFIARATAASRWWMRCWRPRPRPTCPIASTTRR